MKDHAKVLQIDTDRSVNSQDVRIWGKCTLHPNKKSKGYKRNFIECQTFVRLNIVLRTLKDSLFFLTRQHLYVNLFTMRCSVFAQEEELWTTTKKTNVREEKPRFNR